MTFHDNEIHASERDESRWSDWKPGADLWPVRVGGRVRQVATK